MTLQRPKPLLAALLLAASLLAAVPILAQEPNITAAQPELPKQRLLIVTQSGKTLVFHVEMATSPMQQTVGLMFRKTVAPDGGMLFDWGRPRSTQMWMRNTIAPLDMVFIQQNGRIGHIAENTVPQSLAVIDSHGPVRATLELAAGTTERLDIRVGDTVESKLFGNLP